jgi:hypothetical protein
MARPYAVLEAGQQRNVAIKTVGTKCGQCTLTYKNYPVSLMQFILEPKEVFYLIDLNKLK